MRALKGPELAQGTARSSSQHKDLFAPERQRQGREEERGKEGKKGDLSQRDKGLPLDRDRPIGKWEFIKGKGNSVRMSLFVLIGHVN